MADRAENDVARLQVIGAGVGRTGTKSLRDALVILGYPCYHMFEVFRKGVPEVEKWRVVLQAKRREILKNEEKLEVPREAWMALFEEYKAAVDFPACIFYKDLKQQYPHAKVILTVRSRESWYASVEETIGASFTKRRYRFANAVLRHFSSFAKAFADDIDREVFVLWKLLRKGIDDPFLGVPDRQLMMQCFDEHIQEVKSSIPSEDLLIYNVNEGWGPLCRFLGVNEPTVAFPRGNDKAEFVKRRTRMVIAACVIVAVPIILCVMLLAGIYWLTDADVPRRTVT
eukprot:Plantae.Rhodophyta-Purpureofilum_apyrenoidigerum.ctg20757.p1 GENE.Plantae.Rhodophyta-Purpureofilum_apyrenoidigerum.ctg20757~~Plantae.Rhodophyta-Purpureofilum_apyrenoidigerum.ctg20757.p1  ORF type:complete len:299 (-),score=58.96 Plantae.Rhodophyta-Purpureofilum_apyrenoidigerum.ctg20757:236-1090(-)